MLELDNGGGRLPRHVVNGVLVAQPVGTLDRVVHVPSPVVLVAVAEGGVDASLGRGRVASRGEELGYAGRLEALLRKTDGGTETGATTADDERIILVVLDIAKARVN